MIVTLGTNIPYPDAWLPANGGTETEFVKNGRRLLYCYNAWTGKHAYLDLASDMILSDEEQTKIFLH